MNENDLIAALQEQDARIVYDLIEEEKKSTPEQVAELELKFKMLRVKQASMLFKGGNNIPGKSRVGVTRKVKKLSKKKEKFAKNSRKISRGKS